MKVTKPRLLFWDIETSLQLAAVFQLAHNDYINPESLITERYVICGAWKWADEKKVHSVSVLDDLKRFKANSQDDLHVVKTLYGVLSEADVIIHHNGDYFDKRYIDTRALVHGLDPLPPIPSIDTYKVAKSKLLLNSNKLDYLGKLLKVGQKIKTSPGLWMRVLQGDAKAVTEMVRYNKQDVLLLERVFQKLQPYVPNHLNRGLFGETGCPRCGSKAVQSRGVHRAITKTYQRWQCQACSGWFRTNKADKQFTVNFSVI